MRRLIVKCFVSTLVCSAVFANAQPRRVAHEDGLSVRELQALADSLHNLPGRIMAVKIFREPTGSAPAVALATLSARNDWEVLVLRRTDGQKYGVEWKSGKLPYTFAVSAGDALRTFLVDGETAVTFDGCAQHACGTGTESVFSILFYVPSRRTAFIATSSYGKVRYSSNLRVPADQKYKEALDQLVKEDIVP